MELLQVKHVLVDVSVKVSVDVQYVYVTGPAKTGHICTKYTCS